METINMRKEVIHKITDFDVTNIDANLMGSDCPIRSYLFLYVFDEIENILKIPVCKIFENHDYTVFTIRNLAAAIDELKGN